MSKVSAPWRRLIVGLTTTAMVAGIAVQPGIANARPLDEKALPEAQQWNPIDSTERPITHEAGAEVPGLAPVPEVVFPDVGHVSTREGENSERTRRKVENTAVSVSSRASTDVEMLGQDQAKALGIHGVVFRVAVDDASTTAEAHIDYAGFKDAFGGDYASRLQLVSLPDCAISHPEDPQCRQQTVLADTRNDLAARTVTATLIDANGKATSKDIKKQLSGGKTKKWEGRLESAPTKPSLAQTTQPSAQAAGLTAAPSAFGLVALTAAPAGSNGNFAASPLNAAGSWSVGGSTGAFSWSYPMAAPQPATGAGPTPRVALSYSSSRVDGRIANSNTQPGWIGQGWEFDPGYVERSYRSCRDSGIPGFDNESELCWGDDFISFARDGQTSRLVRDVNTGLYRPQQDDGTKIERLTGANNGAYEGEYWKVTTPQGLVYYYGLGQAGGAATNSVLKVPVIGARNGDRCHANSVAASRCTQAWRWNVDYAEDAHGNAMRFVYEVETNTYTADAGVLGIRYDRAGLLSRIDYGMRAEGGKLTTPTNTVEFVLAERCLPDKDFSCSPSEFTFANAKRWPDTPQDLDCSSGVCSTDSPTFWSRKRLAQVNFKVAGTLVDRYDLAHSYPDMGDKALWLSSITHTGYLPDGTSMATPPVKFGGVLLANRVEGLNSMPPMLMWRLQSITDELGATTRVSYSPTDCTATSLPNANDLANNARRCFPVKWNLPYQKYPTLDYFHSYVVTQIRKGDPQSLSPEHVWNYKYLGAPAWHHDDGDFTKPENRTYGQFRGYATVEVRSGDPQWSSNGAPDRVTLTRTSYLRGMDGDTLPGGKRSVQVSTANGEQIPDAEPLAGQPYKVETFLGDGGKLVSTEFTRPRVLRTTATQPRAGLPSLEATLTANTRSQKIIYTAGGGQLVNTTTVKHDDRGRQVAETDSATASPDTCQITGYANNAAGPGWRVSEQTTYEGACSDQGLPTGKLTSASRTYYDGKPLGVLDGSGDPTLVQAAISDKGGALQWTKRTQTWEPSGQLSSATAYASSDDARGRTSSTMRTRNSAGVVVSTVLTNALGHTSTTTLDLRGNPVAITDATGATTTASRDPLGRVTKVWTPDFPTSGVPSVEYSYLIDQNGVDAVTTKTQTSNGTALRTLTSVVLTDALGQTIQTQTQAASDNGGRVIQDSFHDSHGWVIRTNNKWYTFGNPSAVVVNANDQAISSRTILQYDGAGRVVKSQDYAGLKPTRSTSTVYSGDSTTVLPPAGGIAATSYVDARGRQTKTLRYTSTPTVQGDVVSGGNPDIILSTYDTRGNMTSITDAVGARWTKAYDLLGNVVSASDPDSGTSTTTFNDFGEAISTTDARGITVATSYDALGRKTSIKSGETQLASWTYDTLKPGLLTSSTSYQNGQAYTQRVDAYDASSRPTSTTVVIPATEGKLAGSYTTTSSYTQAGQLRTLGLPAAGDLAAEKLTMDYTDTGLPKNLRGAQTYVQEALYSPHGAVNQLQFNPTSNIAMTYYRDPETLWLTESRMDNTGPYPKVDSTKYRYDLAGKITQAFSERTDKMVVGYRTSCYNYNGRGDLSDVWTEGGDSPDGHCGTVPKPGASAQVGGAYALWQTYKFDGAGNRLAFTNEATKLNPTGTTATYQVGGQGNPYHAVMSQTVNGTVTSKYTWDKSGNLASRTLAGITETWNYDQLGRVAKISKSGASTSYIYGADGVQLIRHDPNGAATLWLPDGTEVSASGSSVTALRMFSFAGQQVVQKTATGYFVLYADQTGTATVAHDGQTLTNYVRRTMDPYGNQIGGELGGAWPNGRGYLNAPVSKATGITDVGARKYDASIGRFTSVDPVFDLTSPATHNGYTYSGADPVNHSDPSGMVMMARMDEGGADHPLPTDWSQPEDESKPKRASGPIVSEGEAEAIAIATSMAVGAVSLGTGPAALALSGAVAGATHQIVKALLLGQDIDWEKVLEEAIIGALSGAAMKYIAKIPGVKATAERLKKFASEKISGLLGRDAEKVAESAARACSFSGATVVLLADGSSKPIDEIRVGDMVLASDPQTGEQVAAPVAQVFVHRDGLGELVTDGEVLSTTKNHPFWSVTDQAFEPAADLAPGEQILTAEGKTLTVIRFIAPDHQGTAYNLEIAGVHTYHVGTTGVLVHNNCATAVGDSAGAAGGKAATGAAPEVSGPARDSKAVADSIDKLAPGRQENVRTVDSVEELRETFDSLAVGADRLPARNNKIPEVYRLPDGGVIQWRVGSKTGGETIDFSPPKGSSLGDMKVHLSDLALE